MSLIIIKDIANLFYSSAHLLFKFKREPEESQAMSELYRYAEFGKLSSGLFHDLMNPMTAMTLSIEELEKISPKNADETKLHFEKALRASRRIEQFITTIRMHIDGKDCQKKFSLDEIIIHTIELLDYKSRSSGVAIEYQGSEIFLFGSPLKFQQAALNLISNAIDSYDKSATKDRSIICQLYLENKNIIFSVTDHGSGIPKEIIHKIFDPFFTTKPRLKGTGLGLSNTKYIIEKIFKGTISVKTAEGRGTSFVVSIPLQSRKRAV
jgi:signal transduction histidine kinase